MIRSIGLRHQVNLCIETIIQDRCSSIEFLYGVFYLIIIGWRRQLDEHFEVILLVWMLSTSNALGKIKVIQLVSRVRFAARKNAHGKVFFRYSWWDFPYSFYRSGSPGSPVFKNQRRILQQEIGTRNHPGRTNCTNGKATVSKYRNQ